MENGNRETGIMRKQRLDTLILALGYADTRTKAQSYIRRGFFSVDGHVIVKPGTLVSPQARIERIHEPDPYVGRGAHKLRPILDQFGIDVSGRTCADIGASTGGFTQILLERGAHRVYAVDVGYGQLVPRLRDDPRVIVMERTNARGLSRERIPEHLDLITVDVSFISLKLILPVLTQLDFSGDVITLVKPQFEVGVQEVGKGGIVRDPEKWRKAVRFVAQEAQNLGFGVKQIAESPIPGTRGNREFFLHLLYPASSLGSSGTWESSLDKVIQNIIADELL